MTIKLRYAAAIAPAVTAAAIAMTPVASAAPTACETTGTNVIVCQGGGHSSVSVDRSPTQSWKQFPYTWGAVIGLLSH